MALIAVAVFLQPGPEGTCALGVAGTVRCPGCGLTRAMGALVRGHPVEALEHNLLAPLVGALILASLYLAGGSLLLRRPVLDLPGAVWMAQHVLWVPILAVVLYAGMQVLGL